MPITFWTFLIGSLALAGVPPFAGFWSKDELLVVATRERPRRPVRRAAADRALTAFYMTQGRPA